ncbi:O-methyltransferase-domain-containing protein [Armillaria novae-zelandiae]|uniref:O-methyltransferase-domain-containing protein n=1 Tax=Armillaria novae-zelandiae TaxID=153914 RepID=A0AA39PLG3_9AGAR|nr:O-methyltransferase-domain-containing protein [Armillaria novae-zelandiae]
MYIRRSFSKHKTLSKCFADLRFDEQRTPSRTRSLLRTLIAFDGLYIKGTLTEQIIQYHISLVLSSAFNGSSDNGENHLGTETDLPPLFVDWERSDNFHNSHVLQKDEILDAAIQNSEANGLPAISVSPAQGKLLYLLAKSIGAKRILEVGTLGGYSTIHLARALPDDGKLVSLELDEHHAKVRSLVLASHGSNLRVMIARLLQRISLGQNWLLKSTSLLAPALDSLQKMDSELKFDFAFIDADKTNMLEYFVEAKRLVRKGGSIYVDNVVQNGRVADPNDTSGFSAGVKKFIISLKEDDEVEATTIGTVNGRGYDGFLYAIRK